MNVVKMQVVTKQIRGVSYKPTDLHDSLNSSSVILLRANNIDDGKINFDDVVYVDKSKVSKDQYLKKGDILICASSGSKQLVGKAASFDFDKECTFGAFCKVVRPDENVADYIGKYFQSVKYRSIISNVAIGANINNIRNEHIDSLELPMYSTEKANDIVHLLSKVQSIIEYRKQELSNLDDLIKARFVEMFGNGKHPVKKVEEVCSDIADCPHTTPKYDGELLNPAIRTSEIKKGYITWDTMRYVSNDEYQERVKRLAPEAGDIVYGREGTIGNAAVLPEGHKFCLGQRVMLLRPDYNQCSSEYLLHAVISDDVYRQVMMKNNASTVAHVNVKDVKAFLVPVPSKELQEQFTDFVKQVDKSKVAVQKALDKTQLLFDSLMQKYFG